MGKSQKKPKMCAELKYLSTPSTVHVHTVLVLLPGLVSAVSIIEVATAPADRDSEHRMPHDAVHHMVVDLLPASRALDGHGLQAGLTRRLVLVIFFLLLGDVGEEDSIGDGFGWSIITLVIDSDNVSFTESRVFIILVDYLTNFTF